MELIFEPVNNEETDTGIFGGVGIPVGYLIHKGTNSRIGVQHLEIVRRVLKNAMEQGVCNADEAETIEAEAHKAGLLSSNADIFNRLLEFAEQHANTDTHGFRYEPCDCGLSHGRFFFRGTCISMEPLITQEQAFEGLQTFVTDDFMDVETAAAVFKQAVDAGLCYDTIETFERFKEELGGSVIELEEGTLLMIDLTRRSDKVN
jgi:hypothetical protein